MSVRHEYTDTVRDLQAVIQREAGEKRAELAKNLELMEATIRRQRLKLEDVPVLEERVKNLTKIVWAILGVAGTIGTGVITALLLKGHG